MQRMFKRLSEILTRESVTFDAALLAEAVKLYFPDMRRMINELQRFSITGTLSSEICTQISDKDISALYAILKAKDFVKKKVVLGIIKTRSVCKRWGGRGRP